MYERICKLDEEIDNFNEDDLIMKAQSPKIDENEDKKI